jgi:hypothetical protein
MKQRDPYLIGRISYVMELSDLHEITDCMLIEASKVLGVKTLGPAEFPGPSSIQGTIFGPTHRTLISIPRKVGNGQARNVIFIIATASVDS